MKKLLFILIGLFICSGILAQVPQKISYQAVIRNSAGELLRNQYIGVRISILQGTPEGHVIYKELFNPNPQTNANGLVTFLIGGGIPITGSFSAIDWANGPHFIHIEADPSGGTDYSIVGTNPFLTVPYSFHSQTADEITGVMTENDPVFTSSAAATITLTNISDWNEAHNWGDHSAEGYLTEENHTLSEVLSKGNDGGASQIKNIANPTDDQDAATKAYVDLLEARLKELEEVLFPTSGTFTDTRDDQTYKWVKIGNQIWMAENLKYLPSVVGPGTGSETTPHYYVYDYDGTDVHSAKATANYQNYGVLYNWPAAMNEALSSSANPSGVKGVCPTGWHLPSDAEWTQLVDYVVSQGYPNSDVFNGAGNALKSCRQNGTQMGGECNTSEHPRWDGSTNYGTDEFCFSALPGGRRYPAGGFDALCGYGYWWSATEISSTLVWYRSIYYDGGDVGRYTDLKPRGFSVRCLQD